MHNAVAHSLCDLIDGLKRISPRAQEPIIVHVQAPRLMAPGDSQLSSEQIEQMLGQLARVLAHFLAGPQVAAEPQSTTAAAK